MQLFRTGKQVTTAVKNVARLRTILGTFGRHGLQDFTVRMGLEQFMPSTARAEGVDKLTVPERLRMAFEALGPAFVKLGQLLSNRPDMLPDDFIEEFMKLQDKVEPLPFEVIQIQVEKELGGKLTDLFAMFSQQPLASASIGQVHEATLHTGEEVVVKVQRPDIDKTIRADVSILRFLATMMEKYLPETRVVSPVQMVEEFFAVLSYELDFVVEANTTMKVAENFRDNKRVVVPRVYRRLTTQRVLTLQRLRGAKITDAAALQSMGVSPSALVDIGARAFFKMVMQDGLFHGDLHGGNLFAMRDPESGESQLGIIDFGIVGRLSNKARDTFSRLLLALVMEDYETLCYEYAELGSVGTGIDFESFQREVRNSLAPYMGLSLKDMNIGVVLINSTKIAGRYNIKIPGDWMIVFKAIFTMEGMGRQLDPDFDLLAIGNDLVKVVLKDRYSVQRMGKDFAWVARDLNALLQVMPRQIRWMFRKFNSNDFAFELKFKETEVIRRQMERSGRGIGMSIVSAGFFISAALSLQMQTDHLIWKYYPVPSLVFFFLGMFGFLGVAFKTWK
ncbi:MAG: AarF/ABC1/UbiB kinase family protein [Deltaproteobacteria bacterium]|nr:AarF/ABC1/UbiB kinase family protein [Deltaproteobacteria bacterium]